MKRTDIQNIYALSPMQEGMLFHYQFNKDSSSYFEQTFIKFEGPLDIPVFQKTFNTLIHKHEVLRTVFTFQKTQKPRQVVFKQRRATVELHDLSLLGPEEQIRTIKRFAAEDRAKGFDLSKDLLMRIVLFKTGTDSYHAIWSFHHIIMDGWCFSILMKDFIKIYHCLLKGLPLDDKRPTPYSAYISWLDRQDRNAGLDYWRDYLKDFNGGSHLSNIMGLRGARTDERQRQYEIEFDSALSASLMDAARQCGATVNALVLALWGILLGRLTYSDDVVCGCVVSGRPAEIPGIGEMVGLFINTIPTRIKIPGPADSFAQLLAQVQKNILKSQDYEFVPLVEIMEQSPLRRDLFDHIIGFENYPLERAGQTTADQGATFAIKGLDFFEQTNYDLSVVVIPVETIRIRFKYNSSVFGDTFIRQMADALHCLTVQVADNPNVQLGQLRLSTTDFILHGEECSTRDTFLPLILRHWNETPDGVCAVSPHGTLTNGLVHELSCRVAAKLSAAGCNRSDFVAVSTDRSLEWLVFTLGILQASLIYMPIDTILPDERKRYMISDSGCEILLTDCAVHWAKSRMTQFTIDEVVKDKVSAVGKPEPLPEGSDPAYLIYTSGSSGRPKGVLVEHKAAANFYFAIQEFYNHGFSSMDRCLASTGIGFDVSVAEWLTALCAGSTIVLYPGFLSKDGASLARTLLREAVTFCYIPPSLLTDVRGRLSREGGIPALNKLLVGVEPIEDTVLERYLKLNPKMVIVNGYGPTESCVCATMYRFQGGSSSGERVPIGKPLAKMAIQLRDPLDHPIPVSLPGELIVSGLQVARGYLNNPELTAERFVEGKGMPRLYRTGDRVVSREDGNLQFIGRFDHQVKVRGFRIELGELEEALKRHPSIKNAVALISPSHSQESLLCAYVVTEGEKSVTDIELRDFLANSLPDYMLPSFLKCLPSFPLTENGKIDRQSLPLPCVDQTIRRILPQNNRQKTLAVIWSEVLNIPLQEIGIDDNFFLLGGHSLKASAVCSRVYKELEVELPLPQLFRKPTIRSLDQYLENKSKKKFSHIPVCEKRDRYPLSSAQKRLLVVSEMGEANTSYNMPFFLELTGDLDIGNLRASFAALAARHQSLRTSFQSFGNETVQVVKDDVVLDIPYYKKGHWPPDLLENFVSPFDLNQAPLLRATLAQLDRDRHLLLLDMHHIISDGTSIGILIKEFMRLYSGGSLGKPGIDYCDYAVWQENGASGSDDEDQHQRFWLEQFSDSPPLLNLPLDFPRPLVKDFAGDVIRFQCDLLENPFDTTIFSLLLTVYYVFLHKLSGQEDIVVGVPSAGRPHPDLEPVIGMLVNTLALRSTPDIYTCFDDFLEAVSQLALQAFEHQDFQLDELVARLPGSRDPGRNPLFDAFFVFQNMDMPAISLKKLAIAPHPHPKNTAKFDLLLEATETTGTIYFALEYRTSLFSRKTAERMGRYFQRIFYTILDLPRIRIGDIDILSSEERRHIATLASGPKAAEPPHNTIHQWFSAIAQSHGDTIAVVDGDLCLSYSYIDDSSDHGADLLVSLNPGPEAVVGLLSNAEAGLIPGILAILKAGCVYMPIDPQNPPERKQYQTTDSAACAILTGTGQYDLDWLPEHIANFSITSFLVDNPSPSPRTSLPNYTGDSALYVIYTSGSTGFPKGVILEHGNLMNLIHFQMAHTTIDSRRVLQFASPGFDVSLQEIFSTLLSGGCLCIMDHSQKNDPQVFSAIIERYGVYSVYLPTAYLKFMFGQGQESVRFAESVSHIIAAGEQLVISPSLRYVLEAQSITLHNHYGPSETHVATTLAIKPHDPKPKIPAIGTAIAGSSVYILDRRLNIQPIGVAGELWITGGAVGRGYLNHPLLTEEKYMELPLASDKKVRAYRTGDLARLRNDGVIEFLGRIDNQVKIRGFRVEPGEIESLLSKHPLIKETAVIHRTAQSGENFLCAYFSCHKANENVAISELKSYLGAQLPPYMIPAFFVQLNKIPLTVNGKVNRALLPAPVLRNEEAEPPRSGTESKLASIWADILEVEGSGIHRDSDFFDIGGHSLKATMLAARIHQLLQVKLQLQEIFKNPRLEDLARLLDQAASDRLEAIPSVEKQDYYPLSSAQKRMFVLHQLKNGGTSDNISIAVLVTGTLDKTLITDAFQRLCCRHEALRTGFEILNGKPVQRIHDELDIQLEALAGDNREQALTEFIRPFDLMSPPLFRVGLRNEAPDRHLLAIDIHHIITDGISIKRLLRDFSSILNKKPLPELKLQYKEFACWQEQAMATGLLIQQEGYWMSEFSERPPDLDLPYDVSPNANPSFDGGSVKTCWRNLTAKKLLGLAKTHGATLYMTMLALFNVFLSIHTGEEDIAVGSPVSGRRHPEVEGVVGCFVNTLAMRNRPEGEKRFISFLREVKERTLDALQNQDFQFEELVARLGYKGDHRRNPLFDTMLTIENTGLTELGEAFQSIDGLSFHPIETGKQSAQFALTLRAQEIAGGIDIELRYNRHRFQEKTVQRFISGLSIIAEAVVADPGILLKEIDGISPEERRFLLEMLQGDHVECESLELFPRLFARQVEQTPDRTALITETQFSYGELKRRVSLLAETFGKYGVAPGSIVALMLEPGAEMMMAILAVLEAGGAYLPLSDSFPDKRIHFILRDSAPHILIIGTNRHIEFSGTTLSLKDLLIKSSVSSETIPKSAQSASPENLVYIIYTSGSTGIPKGVAVRHDNLRVQLQGFVHRFQMGLNHRTLLSTAVTFDASIILMFPPLMSGGSLVVTSEGIRKDPQAMSHLILREAVDTMCVVPAFFRALLEVMDPDRLYFKLLLIGGDVFPTSLYNQLGANPNILSVVNIYGPTETTVDALAYSCPPGEIVTSSSLPIGAPMPGYRIAILDRYGRRVPIGVAGEIWIGGNSVSAGYLNRPETTAEVFSTDPNNVRWYRTGDRGLVMSDGNVLFLGRFDFQVKIRGFRIETGDIEAAILRHPLIQDAAVVAPSMNEGDRYLHAFVVVKNSEEIEAEELLASLATELPDYMIPRNVTCIDQLPLNSSGKVNRRELLSQASHSRSDDHSNVPPQSIGERHLAGLWGEILGLEKESISRNDNFFHIGGHSLNASVLGARIRRRLNVDVPLLELFKNPILKSMAQWIDNEASASQPTISCVEKRDYYPLSSPQKRFFYLEQANPGTISFNMAAFTRIMGTIDRKRLQRAINQLIRRHDAFRTYFQMKDGQPVQRVKDQVIANLEEIGGLPAKQAARDFIRPFVLNEAPLFRIAVIESPDSGSILALDMHHIIGDGVSMEVIVRELSALYGGKSLAPTSVQYKDFAVWQESFLKSDRYQKQMEFWTATLTSPLPVLDLYPDFKRPAVLDHAGQSFRFNLDSDISSSLKRLAEGLDMTLYMLLASIFAILMNKYTRQRDLIIGSVVAGRRHEELESVVGLFTNTIPLRLTIQGESPFNEVARQVAHDCVAAFDHQDVPFEELVAALNLRRDPSRNPLFDVGFGMVHQGGEEISIGELTFVPFQFEAGTSKFDLSLLAEEQNEGLGFLVEYRTSLFKEGTIGRLSNHFVRLIRQTVFDSDVPVYDLSLISKDEKRNIINVFNCSEEQSILPATFGELFARALVKVPDSIAINDGDRFLTFTTLAAMAKDLAAHFTRHHHLRDEDRIGVFMKPSLEWAVSMTAVMSSGCAVVPLEVELPEERLRFMRLDAGVSFVIDPFYWADWYSNIGNHHSPPATACKLDAGVDHIAYIIYTSGTTGLPKGVAVSHRGFEGARRFQCERLGIIDCDKVLQFARISFDGAVFELFAALFNGATLCIPHRDVIGNFTLMEKFLLKAHITVAVLPPPYLSHLSCDSSTYLRVLVSAGSETDESLMRRWGAATQVFNGYGPTENTVAATVWRYDPEESTENPRSVPIGGPIPGTRVYVMDNRQKMLPPMVPGELCIGGTGLARGYLNNPELTAWSFVNSEAGLVYRSGDLARFLPNGQVEFLGRIDQQVKIRGQRVELQEIEGQILQFPDVAAATVMIHKAEEGDPRLAAYIVPGDSGTTSDDLVERLKQFLKKQLPAFMVPSFIMVIERIPLTINGKVDRDSLPQPMIQSDAESAGELKTVTEKTLLKIWAETLNIQATAIGRESDFFQLGGHSLSMTSLLSRILKTFNVAIPLATAIANPTISSFGQYIDENFDSPNIHRENGLILLKEGTNQKHLFLVHDGFGSIDAYHELARRISLDMWIWGIDMDMRVVGIKNKPTLKEIAASYIRKIDATVSSKKKKISVGGWSIGGMIAFEMAIQMEDRGEGAQQLFLFDSIPSFIDQTHLDFHERELPDEIRCLLDSCRNYIPARAISTPTLFFDALQSPHPAKPNWRNVCLGDFLSVSVDCAHHKLFTGAKHIEQLASYVVNKLKEK